MSKFYLSITEEQETLVRNAPLFFVASVDPRNMPGSGLTDTADIAQTGSTEKGEDPGPVNVSPKGGSPLHVLGPNRVAYVDFLRIRSSDTGARAGAKQSRVGKEVQRKYK